MQADERVYHISPLRRWFLVGFWVVFAALLALPFVALEWSKHHWAAAMVIALVALGSVLIPLEVAWIGRLVLTAQGIELRGYQGRKPYLATTWQNVAALRFDKAGAEGLVVKEPLDGRHAEGLTRYRNVVINGAPLNDDEKRLLLGEKRFFPIDPFAYWIKHGDLWEQIREHAPWLADAQGQPVGYRPRIPEKPWTRKKTVLLVILIVYLIVLGPAALALPPKGQAIVFGSLTAVMGVSVALYALNNLVAAYFHLRRKHFQEAALWSAMGLIQVLVALAILDSFVRPGH
jgi:hypothetical protein